MHSATVVVGVLGLGLILGLRFLAPAVPGALVLVAAGSSRRMRSTSKRTGSRSSATCRVFGITYERIDDFLEGREVPPEVHEIIVSTYGRTAHKRTLPAAP